MERASVELMFPLLFSGLIGFISISLEVFIQTLIHCLPCDWHFSHNNITCAKLKITQSDY